MKKEIIIDIMTALMLIGIVNIISFLFVRFGIFTIKEAGIFSGATLIFLGIMIYFFEIKKDDKQKT